MFDFDDFFSVVIRILALIIGVLATIHFACLTFSALSYYSTSSYCNCSFCYCQSVESGDSDES